MGAKPTRNPFACPHTGCAGNWAAGRTQEPSSSGAANCPQECRCPATAATQVGRQHKHASRVSSRLFIVRTLIRISPRSPTVNPYFPDDSAHFVKNHHAIDTGRDVACYNRDTASLDRCQAQSKCKISDHTTATKSIESGAARRTSPRILLHDKLALCRQFPMFLRL